MHQNRSLVQSGARRVSWPSRLALGLVIAAATIAIRAQETPIPAAASRGLEIAASDERSTSTPAAGEIRRAIVVGNTMYGKHSLLTPGKDATAVRNELHRLGYEVDLLLDKPKEVVEAAFQKLSVLTGTGVIVFYYAGHGFQESGTQESYIVPINTREWDDYESTQAYIRATTSVKFLMSLMGNERDADPAKLRRIVILDTCRNNGWDSNEAFKYMSKQRNKLPAGFKVCYSTSGGQIASDSGETELGPYAELLVQRLREHPTQRVDEFFEELHADFEQEYGNLQSPDEDENIARENFSFGLQNSSNDEAAGEQPSRPVDAKNEADAQFKALLNDLGDPLGLDTRPSHTTDR